jgi:hypothetical protein
MNKRKRVATKKHGLKAKRLKRKRRAQPAVPGARTAPHAPAAGTRTAASHR